MPIHHAVLTLLVDGPSHGYELKSRFETAIGPQWGGLNIGHLYQILDRLERDGYVTSSRVEQLNRPDRNLYELTDEGRGELARWVVTPHVRQGGYRDEQFLKLLAAARLGLDALSTFVREQRSVLFGEIAELVAMRAHAEDPLVGLLVETALLHAKADLALVEEAEERLAPVAAAAGRRLSTLTDRRSRRRA